MRPLRLIKLPVSHRAKPGRRRGCRSRRSGSRPAPQRTASAPIAGMPAGMRKANLRTPALLYRGMMLASRQSLSMRAMAILNCTESTSTPGGRTSSTAPAKRWSQALNPLL